MRHVLMKVLVLLLIVAKCGVAQGFTMLTCSGNIDVRLIGPRSKNDRTVQTFTISRKEALQLDLSVAGASVGHLFPWDHVVWEEAASLVKFKDVKFKTDDATQITISLFDLGEKKPHTLNCRFSF
jgi:apolipoprotein N-acyltransferase